jgi:FkbM family methyltransferase
MDDEQPLTPTVLCFRGFRHVFSMKLSKLLPPPFRQFVRDRMTVYVYTYGFRPSLSIAEQILTFSYDGRALTARADHRTALYDTIADVVGSDCYQLKKLAWQPHRNHFIVDIGAHVGVTTLVLAQIPGAHVICYEPDPKNCALLRDNIERNSLLNVTVRQAAVGGSNGKLQFQPHTESTGGFLAPAGAGSSAQTLTVDAVTLDRVLEESPTGEIDLLKCDCEGGEYEILNRFTPELAAHIRNLTIEVHDLDRSRNIEWISQKLSGLGYKLSCIPDLWDVQPCIFYWQGESLSSLVSPSRVL